MDAIKVGTNLSPRIVAERLTTSLESLILEVDDPADAHLSGCDIFIGSDSAVWSKDQLLANLARAPIPSLMMMEGYETDGGFDEITTLVVTVAVSPGSPLLAPNKDYYDPDSKNRLLGPARLVASSHQWRVPSHDPVIVEKARMPSWDLAIDWFTKLAMTHMSGFQSIIRRAEALETELARLLSERDDLVARLEAALSDRDFALTRVQTLEFDLKALRSDLLEAKAAQASENPLRMVETAAALKARGKITVVKLGLLVASLSPFVADYLSSDDTQQIVDAVNENTRAMQQHHNKVDQIQTTLGAAMHCISSSSNPPLVPEARSSDQHHQHDQGEDNGGEN